METSQPQGQGATAANDLTTVVAALEARAAPERELYEGVLQHVVRAWGAPAAGVWRLDESRRLRLAADVGLKATGFLANGAWRAWCEAPMQQALTSGETRYHAPDRQGNAPREFAYDLIVGGLLRGAEVVGVVHAFVPPEPDERRRNAAVRGIEQAAVELSGALARRQPGTPAADGSLQRAVGEFILSLYGSLRSEVVAALAANEARRLLGCDRAMVLGCRNGKSRVLAASGQEQVNHRSNLVQAIAALVAQVLATGDPLHFQGSFAGLPTQVEQPLAAYLHESAALGVCILPLTVPMPRRDDAADTQAADQTPRTRIVGALVLEQLPAGSPSLAVTEMTRRFALHTGRALANAQEHEQIFLLPLWQKLGRAREALRGRGALKALAAIVLLAALGGALAVIPADYRVEGRGKLMPVVRRSVFAPLDGEVSEILVASGQEVRPGQPLLRLRSDDLEARVITARNTQSEKLKMLASYQAQLGESAGAAVRGGEIELRGKLIAAQIEIEGLGKQLQVLERQVESLTVRSPIEGVVATFQIEEALSERPVRRGELLLEVMNRAGPWRLELDVPENRLGHVLAAQEQLATEKLAVRYVLATAAQATYDARLDAFGTRTVMAEGSGSVVQMYAALAEPAPPNLQVGAEVIAKINCGPRSLGYVLFGDVVEFFQRRFWL